MKSIPMTMLVSAALVCSGARSPIAASAEPKVADKVVNLDAYPPRLVSFPDGVVGLADLQYAVEPGFRPLTLDLYLPPKGAAKQAGAVVWVHGGGWRNGSTRYNGAYEEWSGVLASLASRGYVVAAVNYRLSSEAPFPAPVSDVQAAIRWLRAHAAEYNIDKTRFAVWGASAGGTIAGLAAVYCGAKSFIPPALPGEATTESRCVQAAVGWFGAYDLPLLNREPRSTGAIAAELAFLGCRGACSADVYRDASAVSHVDSADPPMLIIHGSADSTVSPTQSEALAKALKAAGGKAELLIIPGVAHNWIGKTADSTRNANLQAIDRTFEFFDATIGAK